MITKYDMVSGEQIYRTEQSDTVTVATATKCLVGPTLSLQLLEVESLPEPAVMPPDLATASIPEFLKLQR